MLSNLNINIYISLIIFTIAIFIYIIIISIKHKARFALISGSISVIILSIASIYRITAKEGLIDVVINDRIILGIYALSSMSMIISWFILGYSSENPALKKKANLLIIVVVGGLILFGVLYYVFKYLL